MKWKVPFAYLSQYFHESLRKEILREIDYVASEGDFTLGKRVEQFEAAFTSYTKTNYAIGVASGTAALQLCLESLQIDGEVITAPNTFYATVNAIVQAGAKPVFVDVRDDYNIDPALIENVINSRTKAIMPVHWAGKPAEMDKILLIAKKNNLYVIEDAAQAVGARINEQHVGNFGIAAGFSFHPQKNLNVWGEAGMVVTNEDHIAKQVAMLRNQGLEGRDDWIMYGHNERMDAIQACIGSRIIHNIESITEQRIANARFYDEMLGSIEQISIPHREKNVRHVYHLYIIQAEKRDNLLDYLLNNGIEAKIHYPTPLHLQQSMRNSSYKNGDFPVAERQAKRIITLPAHEHLSQQQLEYVVEKVRDFYGK